MAKKKRPYHLVLKALREGPKTIEQLSNQVYGNYDKYYHNCVYLKIVYLRSVGYTIDCRNRYDGNRKVAGVYQLKRRRHDAE